VNTLRKLGSVADAAGGLTTSQVTIPVSACAAAQLSISSSAASPRPSCTADTITVSARDSYGNLVAGYRGTVAFTSSDPAAILPSQYTFTSTDSGTHVFTGGVTLKTSGTAVRTITATDVSNSSIGGTENNILVTPGAAYSLIVSGIAGPASACTGSNVVVTAYDQCRPGVNVATGYTGTIRFTSTDGNAVLPSNYTFLSGDNGAHTFANGVTLRTAGIQSVSVADVNATGLQSTQSGISIQPASPALLSMTGLTSGAPTGAAQSPVVTVTDGCGPSGSAGNVVTAYRGTVSFTAQDATADLPTNYTFTAADNGLHTFSGLHKTIEIWTPSTACNSNSDCGSTATCDLTYNRCRQWVKAKDTSNSALTSEVDLAVLPGDCKQGSAGADVDANGNRYRLAPRCV
jgi:hypothetical protein